MRLIIVCLLMVSWASATSAEDHYSESHELAAADLLVMTGAKENAIVGASAMADVMVQGNPMLTPYRDVLVEWAEQVMTWENMKPRFVQLYVEAYTEEELRSLLEFYDSPLGRKVLRVTPDLVRQGAMIGGQLAAEHQTELQEMIQKRAAELEQLQQSQ
jgi:hypothetical protein